MNKPVHIFIGKTIPRFDGGFWYRSACGYVMTAHEKPRPGQKVTCPVCLGTRV